jgi:hypothetical protein
MRLVNTATREYVGFNLEQPNRNWGELPDEMIGN